MENNDENELSKVILDVAFVIHKELGPGLFESVYETIMCHELEKEYGVKVQRQFPIPVVWRNEKMDIGFRADLVVDNKLIVEIKSIETLAPVHQKQVLTYLRLTGLKLGLLINFNEALLKNGIKRIVNNL
ncbi:MAG: GxxExxY protein [Chitinophagaceae bacterium]|nr:GxxExxY protein [Chitinophagaceae bacterium]